MLKQSPCLVCLVTEAEDKREGGRKKSLYVHTYHTVTCAQIWAKEMHLLKSINLSITNRAGPEIQLFKTC